MIIFAARHPVLTAITMPAAMSDEARSLDIDEVGNIGLALVRACRPRGTARGRRSP